ncbi:monovalent cation:proton antiporter-2 (CPA2) family protein [Phyllobacterium sp. 21LDTY02-6]|uniref:monovalent cation:proton antiporter-2 (CPA2) family protein n=1 Tax=unclassified Phyllobacterium TaxID=2638441 RepID=UPI002020CCD6|nr:MULTISPECIES: monovalent cation:proton antiporter-2 (CPA2) family protein [unclassified Phyllobacterium]MCO4318661.1 monovalent cation:proton antiporter-2 (CPA2) family protein [Phyllobacterium sp. 21LDTY02-6]MCX8281176.1 monovalent cation:proton antiporter-2 (CPA2) family protein [Phyllobacterium sp. 0TCS1.6C]MCX8294537.1 monovalent cation:proton antiporter-2 (CPA2) family protein [Phyllobacterium sp. 0TCS1.6A]
MLSESGNLYFQALALLAGAIIAAPLFKRLGLGTVLGYLAAGLLIGPVANLITDGEQVLHFSELGVVFLLFVIGLELKPSRLWTLRHAIFGLGAAQVLVTGAALTGLIVALALMSWQAAVITGFGLALSSTAFAMQILEERGETTMPHGQVSFAILLFQDLAIVPLLAMVPVLAPGSATQQADPLGNFLIAVICIGAIIAVGRYLLNPLFRFIANTGAREVMIAAALFVVLGAATLMQFAGLSMAMGAFIAGVLLAESSYRHELEADIEPFRGVFLGLFFMAVGLSLDLGVILNNWLSIFLAVPIFMAVKALLVYVLARLFGSNHNDAIRVAFFLPQGGEFGFVLFSAAAAAGLMGEDLASELVAITTLSMAVMPLSVALGNRFLVNRDSGDEIEENFDGAGADVMMIGFSRYGQIAAQILLAGGSAVTVIDASADRIRSAEKFGFRIYFGDGTRKEVLEAAGIRQAKIVAVCTHRKETTDRIVELIQAEYPDIKLFVRSYDRVHTLKLRSRGVHYELRETFESGLVFGRRALEELGVREELAHEIMEDIRRRDEDRLHIQASQGLAAGNDLLLTRPVTPEPLIKPLRESKRIDLAEGAAAEPASEPAE